jgi:hypothetical protein
VLSTVWNRFKGTGGTTFPRLTAKLWKEAPTIVEYGETTKKKAAAYNAKLKGQLAYAPEWEYDGQDGMYTGKDYQRIPTPDWTAIQQVRYIEVLQRVALEEGVHLRTSSNQYEIQVAPINCSPEDDAWDITYTFVKASEASGSAMTAPLPSSVPPFSRPGTSRGESSSLPPACTARSCSGSQAVRPSAARRHGAP